MAGQVGFGIGFDFNALDKATAKADKDLRHLAEGAEEQAKRIQRAFSISASQGLSQLSKELTNVYGDLAKFSQYANLEFKLGISKHTSGKVINEINDIVNLSRKKFEEINAVKLSGVIDPSIINNVKELENTLTRLQTALKNGGVQKDENTFVRLSMDGRVAVADEIKAIQERLQVMRMSTSEFNKMKSDEVAAVIKNAQAEENAYNEKLKRIEQEKKAYNDKVEAYRKMFDEIDKMESRTRQANYKTKLASGGIFENTNVAQNAMRYMDRIYSNKGVLSIHNMEKALSKLRDAQSRLNLNTEEGRKRYSEVSNAIKRIEKDLEKAAEKNKRLTDESKKLKNEHNALLETAKKLTTRFAQLFSVQAITGYINKLIRVRGEFEMQHKAMQILVGDVDKANALWDKTVSLAVKSPFKVRDLVTYTKQLSAYRIETDKLFEKTKMLADISSGLGVDMNRLILAYGQVKAANYLRGTELRQFSEAGINVLGELATYFSELEDRAVSVGDVFERVSKRLVSFEDVDAVLQRVTGESGAFYKMQEKQSETLKGMMLNLTDTVELMMNDLGKRNDGVLKDSIKIIREIVDNWRKLEPAIAAAGTALLVYFPLKMLGKIGSAIKSIFVAGATHPYALAATAILSLIALIYKAATAQDKLNAAMSEIDSNITKSLNESIELYHKLADATNDVTKSTEERNKAYEQLKVKFQDILPDEMLAREQVESLAGDYRAAEQAMMSYYNAKALQQKKDKVESMFESEFSEIDIPELQKSYKKYVEALFKNKKVTRDEYLALEAGVNTSVLKAVDSAKHGEILNNFDSLKKEIERNLSVFANIDESKLQMNWVGKFIEDINDIVKTIGEYRSAIRGIEGLPFRTYEEELAAADKKSLVEQFEFVKKQYSQLVKINKKMADEGISLYTPSTDKNKEKIRLEALEDLELIKKAVAKNYPQYTQLLKTANDDLMQAAEEGVYGFMKALPSIESSLYTKDGGLVTFVDKMVKDAENAGNQSAVALFDAFAKETKSEGEKKLRGALQNSIINAIDYAINKHNLVDDAKDFMAKIIPDSSKTTSDVRNNIEGIIEQFQQLKKEYAIAISAGAEELPFVEWLDKYANSQTGRSMDMYLYGSAKVLARNEELIPALTTVFKLLGGEFKGKQKKDNLWDERINVIDQMNKKFNELKKTLTESESIQGAFDAYKDAFQKAYAGTSFLKGFNAKQMTAEQFLTNILNFPDKNAIVDFLDELASVATDTDDKIRAEVTKGKYVEEMHIELVKEDQEKVIKDIEDMFGNYEVSMELDKLDIPPELATRLFDFKPTTLKEIKNKIQTEIDEISATKGREDELKQLKSFLERVEDLERKSLEERMKEYIKYLRDEQDERIKITLEGQRKLNDIEKMTGFNDTEKATMSANVRKETKEKLAKAEWEAFAKTPEIIHIFDDIDTTSTKALNGLHDKLQTLKEDLYNAGLPASELKAILDRINQVEDELNSRNPFKNMGEGFKNLFGGLAAKRLAYEDQINKQREADNRVAAERKRLQQFIDNGAVEGSITYNLFQDKVNQAVAEAEALREETKKITSEYSEAQKSAINFTLAIQEGVSITQELLTSSLDLAESFGWLSDEQRNIADTSMNILGDIGGLATSAARIASGDVIGGIASAISSTASLITNINKTGDAVKDMDIARQAKNIERLEKSYEKLEKAMDEAYSIEQLKEAQDAMRENINGQIEALERQKAAEESKKNTDQEAVDDYADQIEELEARKAELQKELVEKMGGTYDYSSVAEQFLDAWLTAFNETGDGLSGLEKEFDSFWKDILKKQVIHGGAAAIVQNYVDEINNALKSDSEDGSRFSEEEKKAIEEAKRQAMSRLNDFYDFMNEQYGLSDIEGAGLTGLQSGIIGMTEEQADILAAYWNAVRLSVSNIDTKFDESINAIKALLIDSDSATENPIVYNLKSILAQATAINTLLNEVRGGSLSNSYIKVQLV